MGIKMSNLLNPGSFFSTKFGKLICQECYDQLLCSDYCCVQAGWEKKPEPQTRSECPEIQKWRFLGSKMENILLVYHSIYVRYDYINQKEAPFKQFDFSNFFL